MVQSMVYYPQFLLSSKAQSLQLLSLNGENQYPIGMCQISAVTKNSICVMIVATITKSGKPLCQMNLKCKYRDRTNRKKIWRKLLKVGINISRV